MSHATDGLLVDRLVAAGVDAYGVEPDRVAADALESRGLDARAGTPSEHLARVAPGSLRACVLVGGVEHDALGVRLVAVDRAFAAVAPGGAVLLLSATPEAWAASAPVVAHDLAVGRPLHADTWRAVLAARGVTDVRVLDAAAVDGGSEPAGYLVVARRP